MTQNLRLQVVLARLGFASRRAAASMIKAGRVKVDGKVILEPGYRIDIDQQSITVDDKSSYIQKNVYFVLNKPKHVVSTVKDRHAQLKVLDLVKPEGLRIYPVGRLDKDTTGLLILTNHGELAYQLTHPKFAIEKIYQVLVRGAIALPVLKELEAGVVLEGKKTYPCKIKVVTAGIASTKLEVRLWEGRNRQIKKMFTLVGYPVLAIHRVGFGPLKLGALKPGQWRELTSSEISRLKRLKGN